LPRAARGRDAAEISASGQNIPDDVRSELTKSFSSAADTAQS
jgi:hypothetical protein